MRILVDPDGFVLVMCEWTEWTDHKEASVMVKLSASAAPGSMSKIDSTHYLMVNNDLMIFVERRNNNNNMYLVPRSLHGITV